MAIALAGDSGKPRPQRVGQRQVEDELGIEAVVVADPNPHRTLEFLDRLVGGEDQGAAGGVLAKQGALGTAQYLHRLDIVEIKQGAIGATEVDVVDVDTDPGIDVFAGIALADTADVDTGERRRAIGLHHIDVGSQAIQIRQIANAGLAQTFGVECGHRQRGFLQAFRALAGSYQHFLEHHALGQHRQRYRTGKRSGNRKGHYGRRSCTTLQHQLYLSDYNY